MGPTSPECHEYTDEEIFHYNFFVWTLAFFLLGLQYTHEDFGPFKRFVLVPAVMKTWGWFLWCYFILWVLFIGFTCYHVFIGYRGAGIFSWYIVWTAFVIGFIYFNTKRL